MNLTRFYTCDLEEYYSPAVCCSVCAETQPGSNLQEIFEWCVKHLESCDKDVWYFEWQQKWEIGTDKWNRDEYPYTFEQTQIKIKSWETHYAELPYRIIKEEQ